MEKTITVTKYNKVYTKKKSKLANIYIRNNRKKHNKKRIPIFLI